LRAAAHPDLRDSALHHNARLIEKRADYRKVMPAAEEFYMGLVNKR
jgi:hypothetical protein